MHAPESDVLDGTRRNSSCTLSGRGGRGVSGLHGWETYERVLDSGGFESRQLVLVDERAVEASETGARWLGLTYWQAVDRFTRGAIRASWGDQGGRLRLVGAATLLRFGLPELRYSDALVSCRYAIEGGLLALRPGGSVTLAQSVEGTEHELSVTVEEYLPSLAARAGAPWWTGCRVRKGAEPVPRGREPPLLRAAGTWTGNVRVTVFGATGVVGRALVPLLAGEHDVVAVSRRPSEPRAGIRWVEADALSNEGARRGHG